MTSQDVSAAITLLHEQYESGAKRNLQLTADRLDTNYGKRIKRDMRDQQSLIFAKALMSVGGTFEFSNEHKKIGYSTIFEAMAAELHEQGANMKTQIQNGEEFEALYRQGCHALNAKLMEEWNDGVVYALPRTENDKAIQVITIDGEFVINSAGETAKQVHEKREKKRATGQMSASAKKLARSVGADKALRTLSEIVCHIEGMVYLPEGSRQPELCEAPDIEEIPEFMK